MRPLRLPRSVRAAWLRLFGRSRPVQPPGSCRPRGVYLRRAFISARGLALFLPSDLGPAPPSPRRPGHPDPASAGRAAVRRFPERGAAQLAARRGRGRAAGLGRAGRPAVAASPRPGPGWPAGLEQGRLGKSGPRACQAETPSGGAARERAADPGRRPPHDSHPSPSSSIALPRGIPASPGGSGGQGSTLSLGWERA